MYFPRTSLVAQTVKCVPPMWETWVRSLGGEDPVEKEMATHSSTLAWKIPWTEALDRLQFRGLQRLGQDWAASLSLSLSLSLIFRHPSAPASDSRQSILCICVFGFVFWILDFGLPHISEVIQCLYFSVQLISFSTRDIHVVTNGKVSFLCSKAE